MASRAENHERAPHRHIEAAGRHRQAAARYRAQGDEEMRQIEMCNAEIGEAASQLEGDRARIVRERAGENA